MKHKTKNTLIGLSVTIIVTFLVLKYWSYGYPLRFLIWVLIGVHTIMWLLIIWIHYIKSIKIEEQSKMKQYS